VAREQACLGLPVTHATALLGIGQKLSAQLLRLLVRELLVRNGDTAPCLLVACKPERLGWDALSVHKLSSGSA
jgi:hypothetical protein